MRAPHICMSHGRVSLGSGREFPHGQNAEQAGILETQGGVNAQASCEQQGLRQRKNHFHRNL